MKKQPYNEDLHKSINAPFYTLTCPNIYFNDFKFVICLKGTQEGNFHIWIMLKAI